MYLVQLGLYGVPDVHVVRDVDVADVAAGYEQVCHLRDPPAPVPVQDVLQTDVHEGVHVDDAAASRALVPQVHRGHLALEALQQDHQAVLGNSALTQGLRRHHLQLLLGRTPSFNPLLTCNIRAGGFKRFM